MIVGDRDSKAHLPIAAYFIGLLGLLAPPVGWMIAGPVGAGVGLLIMLLLLQVRHGASVRH
jgi:hypothetical protein